jgi:ribonuclease P protein component
VANEPFKHVALKRELRLRNSRDFQRVRQQGRSLSSRLLILAWAPAEGDRPRVGLIASRRTFKLAVQRNRIKRRLSEAVRVFVPRLHGVDLVLIARREALEADLSTLRAEVQALLRRARLLIADRSTEAHPSERVNKGRQP